MSNEEIPKYRVIDMKVKNGVRLYALDLEEAEDNCATYKVVPEVSTRPYPKFEVGSVWGLTKVGHLMGGDFDLPKITRRQYDTQGDQWGYWVEFGIMHREDGGGPLSENILVDCFFDATVADGSAESASADRTSK